MRRAAPEAGSAAGISAALTHPGADLAAEADSLLAPLRRTHAAALSYLLARDTLITWFLEPSGNLHVMRSAVGGDSLRVLIAELRAGLGADAARGAMARRASGPRAEQEVTREPAAGDVPGEFQRSSRALVALLLPPEILAAIPAGSELVIIPQGILALVPFAALPSDANDEPLGMRYAIRYAPSLAALNAAEVRHGLGTGRGRTTQLQNALVVGNPKMPVVPTAFGETIQLRSLPGAELEGRRTAAQLGVTPLTGSAASEHVVRQRLPDAAVIHLATHGLAYGTEARVRSSYIALAPDSLDDGLLTVGEILDDPALTLQAELVVLSACQTGLGDVKNAEGTVGLQRAFLARGARSVLVSLWSVDDRATALLMERFYTHWLSDEPAISKAEALRRAQDDVRKTPGFEQPTYWAAFQLVGAR
jgi:CHAT domain-containing protein